jgi:ribosomal protein S3
MGQKSSPVGLRLQINRTWDSRWYAEGQDYGRLLLEDLKIRRHILSALPQAAISKVVIERPAKICRISIYAARPGVIIGKKGADIEKLRKKLGSMTSSDVSLNIVEIRKPEIDAKLVAQGVADQRARCSRLCVLAPRASASPARAVSAVPRSRAPNGIVRVAFRCTRCAATSTMRKPKPTPPTACVA